MPHPDPRVLRTVAIASLPETAVGPVAGAVPGAGYLTQPEGWQHVVITFEQTTNANGSGTRLASATTTADVTVFYWYTADNGRTPITGIESVPGHQLRNGIEALVPPNANYSVVVTSVLTGAAVGANGLNIYAQPIRK